MSSLSRTLRKSALLGIRTTKSHITQTCTCNILQYLTAIKMIIFRSKIVTFFFFFLFAQNIDRGYTLEPPQ